MTIRSNLKKKMPCTFSKHNFRRVLSDQEKNKESSFFFTDVSSKRRSNILRGFSCLGRNVLLSIAKEPANSYTATGRLSD